MPRIPRALRDVPWWLWAIAGLAMGLRLASVGFGLPYELNADERFFVTAAWEMVEDGDWDPEWYGFPAATLYALLGPLFAAYGYIGTAAGAFDGATGVRAAYLVDSSHYFVIGRVVTAVVGTAVVLATYALARELRSSRPWAGIAALVVAISWPILELSSETRGDMPQILALLLLLISVLRGIERGSWRLFFISGVFLGLAVVSKYPAVIGAVPILLGVRTVIAEGRATTKQGIKWLIAAAAASLATAFVVAPYLFIHPVETLYWVLNEVGRQHLGATGGGPVEHMLRYLTEALPLAVGPLGAAMGLIGMVLMVRTRRLAVVTVTVLAYVLFISILSHWWVRWLAPIVPIAAAAMAYAGTGFDRWLLARSRGRLVNGLRLGLAILILAPLALPTLETVLGRATSNDTRVAATAWLEANAPEGSVVLVDSNTLHPDSSRYDVLIAQEGSLVPWSEHSDKSRPDGYFGRLGGQLLPMTPAEIVVAIEDSAVDYIAVSGAWAQGVADGGPELADEHDAYQIILTSFPEVAVFDRSDSALGPEVRLLDASVAE